MLALVAIASAAEAQTPTPGVSCVYSALPQATASSMASRLAAGTLDEAKLAEEIRPFNRVCINAGAFKVQAHVDLAFL